jgi:hypothetical protein
MLATRFFKWTTAIAKGQAHQEPADDLVSGKPVVGLFDLVGGEQLARVQGCVLCH